MKDANPGCLLGAIDSEGRQHADRFQSDLELAGHVGDIANLLLNVKQAKPDLILLDWEVLGEQIDTLQELLELFEPPPAIFALSVKATIRETVASHQISGFAYKGDSPQCLLQAIRGAIPA